ncbi:DUF922 domain-containing Zn-dependent protease [Rhizobium sp. Root708]|uniref:DUF922 domain-containing Zn-dependent protease n=1 Tax=Rhizobium sp. Root708 TaxID=1736592 RepID=UPI0009EC776C|nr:DUF922 domain-containing protein [Rhizobium sp. Root708]
MKADARILFLALLCVFGPATASAQWQPSEEVRTYSISGKTGAELYGSIGERGPEVGGGVRTIAHTTFRLTWQRKYEPRDGACVLASAKPKLVLIYTLPKPSTSLSPTVKASWDTFLDGVRKHEKVHGTIITEMVHDIEAMSVGFSAPDDPDCRKIRVELTKRLGQLSDKQRERGREFDRVEMGQGGNIQALILDFVNGP